MIPLDLIVYSNEFSNTKLSWDLKGSKIVRGLGIDAKFQILPEIFLPEGKQEDQTPLSQDAIVLVHGNATQRYQNITHVRRLSEVRPDLRFIVSIDTGYGRSDYNDPEDYDYARELLEKPFTPLKPVTVTNHHPGAFLSGISATLTSVTRSLENYLTKWKMMKQGHVFNLVIYYDRDLSDITHDNEERADYLGVLYQEIQAGEHCLESGSLETNKPIPQNAVVLVHGNATHRYNNINIVRQLINRRSDLHFILTVDDSTVAERYFRAEEDYTLIRTVLEEEFSASQRVAVTIANPLGFFRGNDVGRPIDCSFENYLKSWKALRGQ